ncbi:hypothetical protein [Pseudomonas carnis]|jgi:hypothetical protein|uniref:Uncharacterized protein n=1 Tax=Pseudomonas carnis TaxID=2487355 RepID=A0ABT5RMJ8_9PSED|nr:hypothetical protein [Pseudomonas carnis]MDD1946632.1 hypothetical protein [Pseudomonas carnis]
MLEPLQGVATIAATNQFFDDLCRLVDAREELPLLRPQVEAYRWETLHHAGMVNTYHQIQGFCAASWSPRYWTSNKVGT